MRRVIRNRLVRAEALPARASAAAMQGSGLGGVDRSRHRGASRSGGLARDLSDMSQFAAELCENCAAIAPIVPSQRVFPKV